MSKRGLPTGLSMRHDAHYVEELSQNRPTPVGRLISTDSLDPNPDQPRVEIGDLTELIASVEEKGILEPLLVRPAGLGRWMIIAGERRWRAAHAAGLSEVPCIEMDVDDRSVAEIALIENLQRKDLTVWEEADGLAALCDRFGYTHEEVAKKMGKSRSTVTESLSIAGLPGAVRDACRQADVSAKSVLLQIVRQPDEHSMMRMALEITSHGMTRDEARTVRQAQTEGRTETEGRPYTYRYVAPGKDYRLELRFKRSRVDPLEIAAALRDAADEVENAK